MDEMEIDVGPGIIEGNLDVEEPLFRLGPNRGEEPKTGNSDPNKPSIIKAKIQILDSTDFNIYK